MALNLSITAAGKVRKSRSAGCRSGGSKQAPSDTATAADEMDVGRTEVQYFHVQCSDSHVFNCYFIFLCSLFT